MAQRKERPIVMPELRPVTPAAIDMTSVERPLTSQCITPDSLDSLYLV